MAHQKLVKGGSSTTKWKFLSNNGNVIISNNRLETYSLYHSQTCLRDGCYRLIIYNSYGPCNDIFLANMDITLLLPMKSLFEKLVNLTSAIEFCYGIQPSTSPSVRLLPSSSPDLLSSVNATGPCD